MNTDSAINLLETTFKNSFSIDNFGYFLTELFNGVKINVRNETKYVKKEFKEYVNTFYNLGSYVEEVGSPIGFYAVELAKESTRDRARTMQRNLIADYMKKQHKNAALVAFYEENNPDWRFSYISLSYEFGDDGLKEKLSSPKRHSFLVGPNEPNHTCQKQFLGLLIKEKKIELDEIKEAFNIENVTDDFFLEYKKLFLELAESLREVKKNNSIVKEEFESKKIKSSDFAKKLMGQLVFIYFLQKKGWLGVEKDANWGTGPKNFLRLIFNKCIKDGNNFYDDILEPLFYEGFSEDVHDDHYSKFGFKVPFLNGGLFEPINGYDWKKTNVTLKNKIFSGILDTFDKFNFTIKEDEPLEKEVAVDPEMLGKVFENLLKGKEQKNKGAYYTPRYIVHYICQESLIQYLSINSEVPDEDLRNFIIHGDMYIDSIIKNHEEKKKYHGKAFSRIKVPNSIKENSQQLDKLLSNVKIIDPAVGSGAFPVAMMNEIVKARHILLLLEGVDDIDFYDLKREIIEKSLYGVDIELSATDITKLRFCLSLIVDEEAKNSVNPLPNLDYKIMCGNSLVDSFKDVKLFDNKILVNSTYYNTIIDRDFEELKTKKRDYFKTFGFNGKNKLKKDINKLKWKYIESHLKNIGKEEIIPKIKSWEDLEDKPFIWELEFFEVFNGKNQGFDIVMGNPPYGAKLSKEEYFNGERIPKKSESYFINLSYNKLLKNNGVLGFIIPKPFNYTSSYILMRNHVLDNIETVIDCGKVWKNVKLEEIILIVNKSQKYDYYNSGTRIDESLPIDCKVNKDTYDDFKIILNGVCDEEINLAKKIKKSNRFLEEISETKSGSDLLKNSSPNGTFEFIGGAEIQREGIVAIKGRIEKKYIKDNDYIKDNSILVQDIISMTGKHIKLTACIPNTKNVAICNTINQIIIDENYSVHFFWTLINSNLINWYYHKFIYANAIRTMHFNNPVIKKLPLPSFDDKKLINIIMKKSEELYTNYQKLWAMKQKMFNCLNDNSIDEISKSIRNFEYRTYKQFIKLKPMKNSNIGSIDNFEEFFNNTKNECLTFIENEIRPLENELNDLIYELYNLTDEEIEIIENNF